MAQKVIFLTTGSSWTVPSDFVSLSSVEGIAGGGGAGAGGAAAGGGAYAASTAIVTSGWTPGTTAITYQIGQGGAAATGTGNAGTDTWFGSATPSTTTGILAKGGSRNSTSTGGAGGLASASVGTITFNGGTGGNQGAAGGNGGGGGAAGPGGVGGNGGNGAGNSTAGTGGGGGSGATLTAPGTVGTVATGGTAATGLGGAGGASAGQTGGNGATNTIAANSTTAPANGGGGGGAQRTLNTGGVGSAGTFWTATAGGTAGSGGGAGGAGGSGNPSAAGLYGAGGGGGGTGTGPGAQGIIVITYNIAGLTRYWVGGAGTWDNSSTTHWSTSSGGASGASAPTPSDTVIFDASSGTGTVTIASTATCAFITCTAASASLVFSGSSTLPILGAIAAGAINITSGSWSGYTGTFSINNSGFTTSLSIASGVSFGGSVSYIPTTSGTLSITANTTIATTGTFSFLPVTAGTLDLTGATTGNFTLSCGLFNSSSTVTRSITFGTGAITTTGSGTAWTTATATGLTYTGTPTVNISNNSATATTVTAHTTGGTETNAFNFNFTTGTYVITLTTGSVIRNLNYTGYTGGWSPGTATYTFYGSLTLVSGMTFTTGSGLWTFSATSGTQVITSAGKSLFSITQSGVGGTVQLAAGTTTLSTTATYTLTNGTLDLGTNTATLSTGTFTSNNSNTRVIVFGTGNITCTRSGNPFVTTTATGLTYTGTPTINISNNSASAANIAAHTVGGTEANSFNFNITVGTYSFSATTTSVVKSLNFTGFTGTWAPGTASCTFFGSLTLVSGMTFTTGSGTWTFAATSGNQTITHASKTLGPITQNGVGGTFQVQSGMTLDTTATFTLTNGTLDLGTNTATLSTGLFNSSNSNTRVIAFGTGNITCTGSGTSLWNCNLVTNLTVSGTPTVNISNNSAVASTITNQLSSGSSGGLFNFYIINGTYTLTIASTSNIKNIDFTGFGGTWTVGVASVYFSGNLTLSSGMSTNQTGTLYFVGTSAITCAGKNLGQIFIGNGTAISGSVTLTDTLECGQMSLYFGTFNASNKNVNASSFSYINNAVAKTLTMGSGTWTLSGTGTVWDSSAPTGVTFNKDTANIVLSNTSTTARTFAGGGKTFNNLTIGGTTGISTLTITGANTFNTIASTKTVAHTITFPNVTTTVSNWTVTGTVGNVVTLQRTGASGTFTLSKTGSGVVSGIDYLNISNSTASPTSTWYAGANSTNGGGNTGWIFSAYSPSTGNYFLLF